MIPVGTKIELHGVDFLREKRIQGSSMGSNRFRRSTCRVWSTSTSHGKLHLDDLISRASSSRRSTRLCRDEGRQGGRSVIVFN